MPKHEQKEITENKKSITKSKHEQKEILDDRKIVSKSKQAQKVELKNKKLVSEPKHGQNELLDEMYFHSKERHLNNGKVCESQVDNKKQRESSKTEDTKVHDKKNLPKEKTPDKKSQSKEHKPEKHHTNSQSKSEKSKSGHQEKIKNDHSLSTEKKSKSSSKEKDQSSMSKRLNRKDTVHENGKKERGDNKTESMFLNEEFEAPTMSFESYLSYDQVSNKRKKKSYPANEPPRKNEKVCKQYCNLERSKTTSQSQEKKEEQVDQVEVGFILRFLVFYGDLNTFCVRDVVYRRSIIPLSGYK